jgi:hypothetical protein
MKKTGAILKSCHGLGIFLFAGGVKRPNSVLRFILRYFKVRKVLIITKALRALNLGFLRRRWNLFAISF